MKKLRKMKRLAIVTTHPIQYNAPLFRLLTQRGMISLKVFYTWGNDVMKEKFDPGFDKVIEWDVPLMDGYDYTFVTNTSGEAGSHHFKGIINPDLIENISAWKADAILVFGWRFKSHLKVIRHFHGKLPVLFRGDSTLLDKEEGAFKKIARSIMLRWVYRHVDIALYVGKANKEYFKKFGLKENQLVFVPHAIDNDRFKFDNGVEEIRTELSIPSDSVVFLFAGKLEIKKNPALLLNAFIQLNELNAHLVIAGNGPLEKKLQLQYGSNSNIHFIPFQNQSKMPALYKACDVFVLPSQGPGETWGLSVNEAMACSRAVLVSDKCGCYPDLVKDNVNGFIFGSNNVKGLAEIMNKIGTDKNKLKEMGAASKNIISGWIYTNICLAIERIVISL